MRTPLFACALCSTVSTNFRLNQKNVLNPLKMSEAKKDHAKYVEDTAASSENAMVEEQEEKMTIQAYLAIAASSP